MPIYEYQCRKCGERFEMFRAITSDDAEVACPACGEKRPQRLISRVLSQGDTSGGNLQFPT